MVLRKGLGILAISLIACTRQVELAPFTSDGCSLFPDKSLIRQVDWCECCVIHDVAYWRGGTAAQREKADIALRQCILEKTGDKPLADLMYEGVRLGGSPYFYNWYRWGYGWSYDRKYDPLSAADLQSVRHRWGEFLNKKETSVCPVATLSTLDIERL